MKKHTVKMVIGIVLIAVGLSGCGKAERDDIAESLNDLQDTESGTDGGIPEHISYSVEAKNGLIINVDADVTSSGFENAPVYEVEVIEIDEELIAEYANRLFDNGKYEVIKPYNMFSMQELKDEKKFLYEQINAYDGMEYINQRAFDQWSSIDGYINNYNESNVSETVDGKLIYEEYVPSEKVETPLSSQDKEVKYLSARLRGMVDGEQWELLYEAIDGIQPKQLIDIYSCERAVHDSWIVSMDDEAIEEYGENFSNLESSQKTAEDMLAKLGYENMEVIHTGQIVQNNHNVPWTDGYKFVFARSVGTMQIGYKDNSVEILGDFDNDFQFGVQQEYIHVYVSDNSVYRVTIDNIIEIGDMLSGGEQTSLMNFEKIDSIVRELMAEGSTLPWYPTGVLDIDSVSLKYLLIPFEDGRHALMPVWSYYMYQPDEFNEYSDSRFASIGINAADGSIIQSVGSSGILIE